MSEQITILITGVGMGIGYGAIKALKTEFGNNTKIIGVDARQLSVGFYMVDKAYKVPMANKHNYISTMIDICEKEAVDVVLPCTDHELIPLSKSKKDFKKVGSEVIVSPLDTIETCRDKWLMYKSLHKKLPISKSALPNNNNLEKAIQFVHLPAVLKPRNGHGSKNIFKINSIEDARNFLQYVQDPVMQTWENGVEYTVDCLASKDGTILCVIPRIRKETIAGFSSIGMIVRQKELIKIGRDLGNCLKFIGPFNFQALVKDNEIHIIEINPRIAGSANISLMAGVNLAGIAVRDILGMDIAPKIDFRDDILVFRYIDDIAIEKNKLILNDDC